MIGRYFPNMHYSNISALLREVVDEYGRNVPDTEMLLAFVKPGQQTREYIPKIRDFDLEKDSSQGQ